MAVTDPNASCDSVTAASTIAFSAITLFKLTPRVLLALYEHLTGGEKDWQSPYERVIQFSDSVQGKHVVVPNVAHDLGKDYVAPVLAEWIRHS